MIKKKELTEKDALQYTYRLLSIKDRSSEEIRQKLILKGYDKTIVNYVVTKLKDNGYINDIRFAEKLLRYAIREKCYGKNLIKPFLLSKGIDKSIIDNIELSDVDFEDSIRRFVSKKQTTFNGLTKDAQMKKIIKALQSKGHDYETINKVLSLGENNG